MINVAPLLLKDLAISGIFIIQLNMLHRLMFHSRVAYLGHTGGNKDIKSSIIILNEMGI